MIAFVEPLVARERPSISYVTRYELRRGVEVLRTRGEGAKKAVRLTKFLEVCEVLGLDGHAGEGWNLAARLWVKLKSHKPSLCLSEADLLVAATAAAHGRVLVTADVGLVRNLQAIEHGPIELVPTVAA